MVVRMEEMRKGPGPVALSPVGPAIRPLLLEGEVEPLDLPIGLGSVGPTVAVLDVSEGLVEELSPVTEAVVGQHPLDDDAVGS